MQVSEIAGLVHRATETAEHDAASSLSCYSKLPAEVWIRWELFSQKHALYF